MDQINDEQRKAYDLLDSDENIFLTGAAGSGKTFLLRKYLHDTERFLPARVRTPILASTGAAAILAGGRTFHSFFGLGVMRGGIENTVSEALNSGFLCRRMQNTSQVIIDEVSMISGPVLACAERIARGARAMMHKNLADKPWGGMRIIVVGDFSQLPPVNPHSKVREWAFLDEVWKRSDFKPIVLTKVMRTDDPELLEVLNKVRIGIVDAQVSAFLDSRAEAKSLTDVPRLFSLRDNTERYNLERLAALPTPVESFRTTYKGDEWAISKFQKNLPIPNNLQIKLNALVMLRTNTSEYANGSLGHITEIERGYSGEDADNTGVPGRVIVRLLSNGKEVGIYPHRYECFDADGRTVLEAINFPMTLAWAMTIHKAQGITVDAMIADIRKLWEPGQAYVALSRARSGAGLFLEGWSSAAIFADKQVLDFHRSLQ